MNAQRTLPRRPTLIGFHLVWTGYGQWLPNDPRGSMSRSVASEGLAELGEIHYGRRAVQPRRSAVNQFYGRANPVLKHPRLRFDADDIATIADGLANCIRENGFMCYACAILHDHIHMVIRKHRQRSAETLARLQAASRAALWHTRADLLASEHPIWTVGGWQGILNTPERVRTTIRYIEGNPPKEHLPPQAWPFVTPYDNWPFHRAQQPR